MIKCDRESGAELHGHWMECIAEYGVLSETLISEAPEVMRLQVAAMLTEMLKKAIMRTTGGGEENEES